VQEERRIRHDQDLRPQKKEAMDECAVAHPPPHAPPYVHERQGSQLGQFHK
jgi:hypothetical protein